jgi:hypothetical protein
MALVPIKKVSLFLAIVLVAAQEAIGFLHSPSFPSQSLSGRIIRHHGSQKARFATGTSESVAVETLDDKQVSSWYCLLRPAQSKSHCRI